MARFTLLYLNSGVTQSTKILMTQIEGNIVNQEVQEILECLPSHSKTHHTALKHIVYQEVVNILWYCFISVYAVQRS